MVVENASLFSGMGLEFMEELNKHLVEERLDAGAFLYKRGAPAGFLYILIEGRVRVILGDQGQVALVVSRPGEAIGWSSLVEQEDHTTTAECLVPCRVNKIAREKLAEIFERYPASGLRFYRGLAKLLRRQLLDTYSLIPAAHGEKHITPGF